MNQNGGLKNYQLKLNQVNQDKVNQDQVNKVIESYQKLLTLANINNFNNLKKKFYLNYGKLIESSSENQINRLKKLKNEFDKQNNSNRIFKELEKKYKTPNMENLQKLFSLARIGTFIESIKRMQENTNNRRIMLKTLQLTLEQNEQFLKDFDEFKKYKEEYENLIKKSNY